MFTWTTLCWLCIFSYNVAAVDKMPSAKGQDTRVGIEAFEGDAADLQYLQFGKAHLRIKIFDLKMS